MLQESHPLWLLVLLHSLNGSKESPSQHVTDTADAPPGGGASFQRWTPGPPAQAPVQEQPVSRGEDFIVPKLGSGPQRYKYNIEQMLTIYVSLMEGSNLGRRMNLSSFGEELPDETTHHQLLTILEGIASQMVGSPQGQHNRATQ